MHSLADDYHSGILSGHEPPCLSLYQPTSRHAPGNQQDPIRFRNLVKVLEGSLTHEYRSGEIRELLEPFEELAGDRELWRHTLDGLVVLRAADLFRVYRLQRPMPELAIVAGTFHTKPLLRFLQTTGGYQVLGLNRQGVRLFEGDRDVVDEVRLAEGVPRTSVEALGEERTEPHLTVAAYGGAGGTAMVHGHGGKSDEVDKDAERFFRMVDEAVLEHHSRPSGRPLILAALPEHQSLFRQISQNPLLLETGISVHPDDLEMDELRERAWRVLEPHYAETLERLADHYGQAKAKGQADDDPARIAEAVIQGRVGTLLLEADRTLPGRVDPTDGSVALGDLEQPHIGDVLDDLAELVQSMGGEVVVAPSERMPSTTGAAAVFRF